MLYKSIIEELVTNKIDFLIIGSYARLWNKFPLTYPKDLDIWLKEDNKAKTFLKYNYNFDINDKCKILEILKAGLRVNIFIDVEGLEFNNSYSKSKIKKLENNIIINYIDKLDCIINLEKTKQKWDL